MNEYSLNIKFIDKSIYFIKEFIQPLQEKILRRAYYNDILSKMDIYQTLIYEELNNEKAENYFIAYQELLLIFRSRSYYFRYH